MNLSLMKSSTMSSSSSSASDPLTIICFTCGMPSSREWAQRVQSRPSGSDSPYFPFLLQLNPPQGAIIKEDASTYLCAFCNAALEYQWNIYELDVAKTGQAYPPAARKYSFSKFSCAVCGVETYRKRIRALPFQEFPFLAKNRQPGSLTLGNNPLAVVCLDCSETLWAQSAEYDRWGLPVDKRHFNWMMRPPPPEDSVEATVARLPSGETQLPRCPPIEPPIDHMVIKQNHPPQLSINDFISSSSITCQSRPAFKKSDATPTLLVGSHSHPYQHHNHTKTSPVHHQHQQQQNQHQQQRKFTSPPCIDSNSSSTQQPPVVTVAPMSVHNTSSLSFTNTSSTSSHNHGRHSSSTSGGCVKLSNSNDHHQQHHHANLTHSPPSSLLQRHPHPLLVGHQHHQSMSPSSGSGLPSFGVQFPWTPPGSTLLDNASSTSRQRSISESEHLTEDHHQHNSHANLRQPSFPSTFQVSTNEHDPKQNFPPSTSWPWLPPFPSSADIIRYQSFMSAISGNALNLGDMYSANSSNTIVETPTSSSSYLYPFTYPTSPHHNHNLNHNQNQHHISSTTISEIEKNEHQRVETSPSPKSTYSQYQKSKNFGQKSQNLKMKSPTNSTTTSTNSHQQYISSKSKSSNFHKLKSNKVYSSDDDDHSNLSNVKDNNINIPKQREKSKSPYYSNDESPFKIFGDQKSKIIVPTPTSLSETAEKYKEKKFFKNRTLPKKLQWKLNYSKKQEKILNKSIKSSSRVNSPTIMTDSVTLLDKEKSKFNKGNYNYNVKSQQTVNLSTVNSTLLIDQQSQVQLQQPTLSVVPEKKKRRVSSVTSFSIVNLCKTSEPEDNENENENDHDNNSRNSVIVRPSSSTSPDHDHDEIVKKNEDSIKNICLNDTNIDQSISEESNYKFYQDQVTYTSIADSEKLKVKEILDEVRSCELKDKKLKGKVDARKQSFLLENFGLVTKQRKLELELDILIHRSEKNTLPPIKFRPQSPMDQEPTSELRGHLLRAAFDDPSLKSVTINPNKSKFLQQLGLKVATRTEKSNREKNWRLSLAEKMLREKRKPYLRGGRKKPWDNLSNLAKILPINKRSSNANAGSRIKRKQSENYSKNILNRLLLQIPKGISSSSTSVKAQNGTEKEVNDISADELIQLESKLEDNQNSKIPVISYPKYIPSYLYKNTKNENLSGKDKDDDMKNILKIPVLQKNEELKKRKDSSNSDISVIEDDGLLTIPESSELFDMSLVVEHLSAWKKFEESTRKILDSIGLPTSNLNGPAELDGKISNYLLTAGSKSVANELRKLRVHLSSHGRSIRSLQKELKLKETIFEASQGQRNEEN